MTEPFLLSGYEDLEISTQILMRDAKNWKIDIELVDRKENFLLLTQGSHREWIKEASKTRLDSYMTFLAMENKTVSKRILSDAGLRVPKGKSFDNPKSALEFFSEIQSYKMVVKPTTTNFGIGISILEPGFSKSEYESALGTGFSHSSSVIVEEFLSGPEYRFLVLGGEVTAVCNRVPANVLGDGSKTIKELISEKNSDPRRGLGHTTPLEKIQLGTVELTELQKQELSPDSVPSSGQTVFLRKNSNISTGGDSLDKTDDVHPSYKEIAIQAANSVGAMICGVDIISSEIESQANFQNHGILEINFNPVLYIHNYPYQGKNRNVGEKILSLLGFEKR